MASLHAISQLHPSLSLEWRPEPCVGQNILVLLVSEQRAGIGELRTLWVMCTRAIYMPF